MNDSELDALERAMNAWELDEAPGLERDPTATRTVAQFNSSGKWMRGTPEGTQPSRVHDVNVSDDLIGYVMRQQQKGTMQLSGAAQQHQHAGSSHWAAKPNRIKTYGYQEPTLFEKRKPQPRLIPLEERHRPGGWNDSTLPQQDVVHRGRRSVPLMTRRTSEPTSKTGDIAHRGHSAVLQPSSSHDSGLRGVTSAPPLPPPQVPPTQANPQPLKRNNLLAPIRRHVIPRNGPHMHVQVRDKREKVISPVPVVAADVSTNHASSTVLIDGGEEKPQAAVVDDIGAALRNSLSTRLQEISDARADKSLLSKRILALSQEVDRVAREMDARRVAIAQVEKRVHKAKDHKRELGQLIAVHRTKENRLADVRGMLKQCLRRVEEARTIAANTAQEGPPSSERPPVRFLAIDVSAVMGGDDVGDATDAAGGVHGHPRNAQRSVAALKLKWNQLTEEHKKLVHDKAKLATTTAASVSKRTAVQGKQRSEDHLETLVRQRENVMKELERRARSDFEVARQHILQNHEKGMNYRGREQHHSVDAEIRKSKELQERVVETQDALKALSKALHELSSKESALKVQARDAEQRRIDSEQGIVRERALLAEALANQQAHAKKLEAMAQEKKLLSEKLSNPQEVAAVQQIHDDERKSAMLALTTAQEKQHDLIKQIGATEERLSDSSLFPRHRSAESSKPISKAIPELRLRIQQAREEIQRVATLAEDTRNETDARKKDMAKNKKLRQALNDKKIEELTKELASLKETNRSKGKENHQLESALDMAERMISMNNLRHT